MSTDSLPPPPAPFLPQYGFADEVSFERLAEHNPFLFRVYTPKAHDSDATYDKDIFCVAPRFNALYHSPIDELTELTPAGPIHEVTSCSDIVQHMEWTSRSSSAYLTTSMSFAWAIWEAMRRYTNGFKHDVEIAVLDARALQGRAVTAYHIMKDAPLEEYVPYTDFIWMRWLIWSIVVQITSAAGVNMHRNLSLCWCMAIFQ